VSQIATCRNTSRFESSKKNFFALFFFSLSVLNLPVHATPERCPFQRPGLAMGGRGYSSQELPLIDRIYCTMLFKARERGSERDVKDVES
jgi:hypothetical protein